MYGLWHSDSFDDTADYLILDDFNFDFFPGMRKGFWGAQEVITTTDKYRKGVARWGKPLMWLCNDELNPFEARNARGDFVMPESERAWYRANCVEIRITEPMFRVEEEVSLTQLSANSLRRRDIPGLEESDSESD